MSAVTKCCCLFRYTSYTLLQHKYCMFFHLENTGKEKLKESLRPSRTWHTFHEGTFIKACGNVPSACTVRKESAAARWCGTRYCFLPFDRICDGVTWTWSEVGRSSDLESTHQTQLRKTKKRKKKKFHWEWSRLALRWGQTLREPGLIHP